MGIESTLRQWALRSGLQRSRIVVAAYRRLSLLRFRGRWDDPVQFRGAWLSIGKDLSLYPSVQNGGFESHELEALLARVSPTDTVWDVGANIGIYSVLLGRAAHEGHVIAFEPVPTTRERLLGNLRRNDVTNVTVEPTALSDRTGGATMAIYPDAPGCDRIMVGEPLADAPESIGVTTTTGAQYADGSPFGAPDVIKVDIEGHELEFLRGAWEIIRNRRPTLMMEINPGSWVGDGRFAAWAQLLDDLFDVYADGQLFDVDGGQRVTSIDTKALPSTTFNLLLPGEWRP